MSMITLIQYAERHKKTPATVRQLIARGAFTSATKIGRDWMIDENEPYPDRRRKGDGFEMRHGMYVVDEIASPLGSSLTTFVRIGKEWYRKPKSYLGISPTNPAPIWVPNPWQNGTKKYTDSWLTAIDVYGCIPSDTDFIRKQIGRAATEEEVEQIITKYGGERLGERDAPRGAHWGPEYVVMIREVVIELSEKINAIDVEDDLMDQGISTFAQGPHIIAIRIR